jgi:hypothetical protein
MFDQMTFRTLLLQSSDEVRAQIISEYSSADKQISIWSDDEAIDNVVTTFRQAINRGQSGPNLAGAVCNSIIANQPLELTGHGNRNPDTTAANSVLAYKIFNFDGKTRSAIAASESQRSTWKVIFKSRFRLVSIDDIPIDRGIWRNGTMRESDKAFCSTGRLPVTLLHVTMQPPQATLSRA